MGKPIVLLVVFLAVTPCHGAWKYQTVAGAGGVPLNVVTAGEPDHPAILFIHGIGQSHYSFVRQLDSTLADEFYLVSFDLRGHGASGKPWLTEAYTDTRAWAQDVAAVLEATGAGPTVMVAWSYGTLVALDYVRELGVGGLAGLNLTGAQGALLPFRMPSGDDPLAAEFSRVRALQLSTSPADNLQASQRMVDWLTAKPMSHADRQVFLGVTLMFPAYARQAMLQRRPNNQDLLAQLTMPTLLSVGEEDSPALAEDALALSRQQPNFRMSKYQGAGHSVFFEQPERFNGELREFARRAHGVGVASMR